MINLLPKDTKRQLRAARANVLLVRYTALLAGAVVFLALGVVAIYFVMSNIKSSAVEAAEENRAAVTDYASVQQSADEFRQDLSIAKTILDREVIYSDAILDIAQVIPSGVIIDSLSLSPESFGSPMSISAQATSYDRAIALKDTLEDSDIFSDVHFTTVSGSDGDNDSGYPYTVNLNAVLTDRQSNTAEAPPQSGADRPGGARPNGVRPGSDNG